MPILKYMRMGYGAKTMRVWNADQGWKEPLLDLEEWVKQTWTNCEGKDWAWTGTYVSRVPKQIKITHSHDPISYFSNIYYLPKWLDQTASFSSASKPPQLFDKFDVQISEFMNRVRHCSKPTLLDQMRDSLFEQYLKGCEDRGRKLVQYAFGGK